jgi:ribosomal protein L37AE/L43A
MRRNQRNAPSRRANPLRDMVADQKRAAEALRARERAQQLKANLPSLIEDQVGEHIQKLESKLLKDFKQMGQRAIEESTAVLNEQLSDRIETLEQISSIQSQTIVNLRDSSKAAEEKVSSVVNSIEKTLSGAVPGFRLEASHYAQPQIEEAQTALIRSDALELEDVKGKYGFCPNCTSTNVRRAYRKGLWEEFLRLFFIAPFRCRACRHKFYRF